MANWLGTINYKSKKEIKVTDKKNILEKCESFTQSPLEIYWDWYSFGLIYKIDALTKVKAELQLSNNAEEFLNYLNCEDYSIGSIYVSILESDENKQGKIIPLYSYYIGFKNNKQATIKAHEYRYEGENNAIGFYGKNYMDTIALFPYDDILFIVRSDGISETSKEQSLIKLENT